MSETTVTSTGRPDRNATERVHRDGAPSDRRAPEPLVQPGTNIALKLPTALYDDTVSFYRDTLGFVVTEVDADDAATVSRSHTIEFGPVTLWLDQVDTASRSDVWFELTTHDLRAARQRLIDGGAVRCDEVEPLAGTGETSHWMRDPAGTIHLLHQVPKAEPET